LFLNGWMKVIDGWNIACIFNYTSILFIIIYTLPTYYLPTSYLECNNQDHHRDLMFSIQHNIKPKKKIQNYHFLLPNLISKNKIILQHLSAKPENVLWYENWQSEFGLVWFWTCKKLSIQFLYSSCIALVNLIYVISFLWNKYFRECSFFFCLTIRRWFTCGTHFFLHFFFSLLVLWLKELYRIIRYRLKSTIHFKAFYMQLLMNKLIDLLQFHKNILKLMKYICFFLEFIKFPFTCRDSTEWVLLVHVTC
jgi:hypothetical protein